MGYYHICLSAKSSDMCTIITEFGKFCYKRLPMGVSCSPDIFQAKIYELLGDIEGTKAYIDESVCHYLYNIFAKSPEKTQNHNIVRSQYGILSYSFE